MVLGFADGRISGGGFMVRACAILRLVCPGMAATGSPTLQALRSMAGIPDSVWSAQERACGEGFHHLWVPAMYVHAEPGGRIQFWRCRRCRQHKLQVVNSGETVYASTVEGGEREGAGRRKHP